MISGWIQQFDPSKIDDCFGDGKTTFLQTEEYLSFERGVKIDLKIPKSKPTKKQSEIFKVNNTLISKTPGGIKPKAKESQNQFLNISDLA